MSKPNLKTLINNIKSNKVYTKNIGTNNEYGFNLNNKSNDRSKNHTDNILRRDNQNYRESATDSAKKPSKSPNITRFTNQIQPVVNSQQHSIPQQFKLNTNAIAEESEFSNFELELKKNQRSDIQQHKKNISDLPMNYSNFDTYNNDSFREKNSAQNYLEHSEKKPRMKENPNLPKSKTKIQLNKNKKISSEFAYGISDQRILSNKKKSKDKLNNEDQRHFPSSINNNENNFSNNLIYKSQFANNGQNGINNPNNPSNPFKTRPNNPISNALEDREKHDRFSHMSHPNNNVKKSAANNSNNNNNNFSVNNINFNNNILHPNSMRVSNASAKSGISFSNNINNLNNNLFVNNQPTKNEMIKNNYLIDLLKESGNESNKNSNNKFIKMNTVNNNNIIGNPKNILKNDLAGSDYNNDLEEDEDGKLLENNFINNKAENNNFYDDEAEVDFIDNNSFDNKDIVKKDYFYIAVEQSQKLLNSKNSYTNNLSPNFNMAHEQKGFVNHKLINNDLLNPKENKKEKELAESEIQRSINLQPKKNLKLNTKISEENSKKRVNDLPDGAKSDYQPNGRNQFFFDGKPASAGVYSNRHQESNKDLLLFNLNINNNNNYNNNNNSNNNSNNKIDLKNNTFARDGSMQKEKDEGEGPSNASITSKEFFKTLEIMKNYLKIEQKQFLEKQNDMIKKNQEKDSEISRLRAENRSLKNQNLDLKTIIHKIFFTVKSYEAEEVFREQKTEVIANQLLAENEYLRYICDNVIKTEIVNSSKDQQIIEKAHIKEKLANERSTTESNVLQDDEVDPKSKGLHKRQKTHINILTCGSGSVNTSVEGFVSNETSRNSIKSSTEDDKTSENENTINNNEKTNKDLFGLTLNEFKEEKKNRRIRIKVDEDKDKQNGNNQNANSQGTSNNPGSTKNSAKQVYLFYRTPSNKENKKIDFSSVNFKPN